MEPLKPKTVEHYMATFDAETQLILRTIQQKIKETESSAVESISYGMPAFKLYGKPLVYFGGFKNHIGFYALPSGNEAFQKELASYKQGKGSIQFPLDRDIPYALIEKIVKFRVAEINSKIKSKNPEDPKI